MTRRVCDWQALHGVTRWPIGRFKGRTVDRLPGWYVRYMVDQPLLAPALREALEAELDRRFPARAAGGADPAIDEFDLE